ncbi:MAG: RNA methyltransferase [Candidatus Yanofskybacteria bacterium]|nr:RNA methyltransferase [Candidatus Yanofskybacteria bacterium]
MSSHKVTLVLHNIRSALNVGSLFRTADAAGVSKIYLGGYTPTPEHDKVSKTALGAEKSIPWEKVSQTWRVLDQLKKEGNTIVALEQSKDSIDYRKCKPRFPLVLVLGNEITGLSSQLLKYCDYAIEIPMRGTKESLNVAVAGGIALYKLLERTTPGITPEV